MTTPMKSRSAWQQMRILARIVWPRGQYLLQLRVLCCMALLGLTRLAIVAVPIIYKRVIDTMNVAVTKVSGKSEKDDLTNSFGLPSQWSIILLYIGAKSLVGNSGYLNVLRSYLWLPVSQQTHKRLRVALFSHILNLSLRWHLARKTGEVLRVIDRGVTSLEIILNEVLFSMVPAAADVTISLIFFLSAFDFTTGVVIGITMIGYVLASVVLTRWKYGYRRERNQADNVRQAAIVDAILNFETVKYYAAEEWEVQRYSEALEKHMYAEWLMNASAELRHSARRTMMSTGLAIGSLLCATYVNDGRFTVGDYVLFVSYLEQVYVPLNSFGDYYKKAHQATVDMENMFDILEQQPEILDAPDARPLQITGGLIEFRNVSFHYIPERPLLHDISWTIAPGKTLAIVGQSGFGKSTILRLLLRFYDVTSGAVLIDGQDIRSVTQQSIRQQIGVVPQDTVLFNKDIEYNIRYGRPTATDKEIKEAAMSAEMHKRIEAFVDGYNTKVGERGLKLSGGEKQRIAIARTVLKRAKIIVLDEATSALDTKTERKIQAAISRVCRDKTTIIVAHRLSTIVHADLILVLEDGRIVENGKHEELVSKGGRYAEMWSEQLRKRSEEDELSTGDETELSQLVNGSEELEESSEIGAEAEEVLLRRRQTGAVDDGIRYIPRI